MLQQASEAVAAADVPAAAPLPTIPGTPVSSPPAKVASPKPEEAAEIKDLAGNVAKRALDEALDTASLEAAAATKVQKVVRGNAARAPAAPAAPSPKAATPKAPRTPSAPVATSTSSSSFSPLMLLIGFVLLVACGVYYYQTVVEAALPPPPVAASKPALKLLGLKIPLPGKK